MGLPFFTGFYSKDLILEIIIGSNIVNSLFFYNIALFAAGLTAMYSSKIILLAFIYNKNKSIGITYKNINEPGFYMSLALFLLTSFSIFIGYIYVDIFVGNGSPYFYDSIFILPNNNYSINMLLLNTFQKNYPLIITIVSAIFIYFIKSCKKNLAFLNNIIIFNTVIKQFQPFLNKISSFFFLAALVNIIYNNVLISAYNFSYKNQTKLIDKGILELFGSIGIFRFVKSVNRFLKTEFSVYLNVGLSILNMCIITIIIIYASIPHNNHFFMDIGFLFVLVLLINYELLVK